MTDTTLPDPLVPAEVDLNGYGFMPMLHHRVLQSTLFIKSTGDEFKAAFALWCASWSEKPAGSLPDDDEMLEHLSRSKTWKKVRDRAMHGWIRCSDGRLYHPTLAPLAIDAWARREEFREVQENRETRQERWRAKVKELSEALRALGVTPPRNASLEKLEAMLRDAQPSQRETVRDVAETSRRDAAEMALTETGTGTETGNTKEEPTVLVAGTSYRPPPTPNAELVELYHRHLPTLPRVEVLNDSRKRAVAARWREVCADGKLDKAKGLEWFAWYFAHAGKSRFLTGQTPGRSGRTWMADFDFLMTPSKFAKVVEGSYHKDAA